MKRFPTPKAPSIAERRQLHFLIEGGGEVIQKFYFPALQRVQRTLERAGRSLRVAFADDSSHWNTTDKPAREALRKALVDWGATSLDKAIPDELRRYQDSRPDVVFIATADIAHVSLALEWLKRDVSQIFVEKPLDRFVASGRRLLDHLDYHDSKVLAFDHYQAKLRPSQDQLGLILSFLKRITGFVFYFLEDGSGGLRNGPIENTRRVDSLERGLILDSVPHALALLNYWGDPSTVRIDSIQPGRYTGVDYNPGQLTLIKHETFAHIAFHFRDATGKQVVPGHLYVGKGIRGVRDLQFTRRPIFGDVKLLDLLGDGGKRVRFNLLSRGTGAGQVNFLDKDGHEHSSFRLNTNPYDVFLLDVANATYWPNRIGFLIETAQDIMEIIEHMWSVANDHTNVGTYPLGASGGTARFLDEVLEGLPICYTTKR